MAQNAYCSPNISNSNIVAREGKKRVHNLDDSANNDEHGETKIKPEDGEEELPFYPAFCFPASPTHFTWVKMSIAEIHRLRSRNGFEGIYQTFHYHSLSEREEKDLTRDRPEYILPQKPPYPIHLSSRLHPDARRIRVAHSAYC